MSLISRSMVGTTGATGVTGLWKPLEGFGLGSDFEQYDVNDVAFPSMFFFDLRMKLISLFMIKI